MKSVKKHLDESGMTYWQHLGHSFKQSYRLTVISVKSIIHGVLPWFFSNAGPLGVYKIYNEIRKLHHVQKLIKRNQGDEQ